MAHQGWKGDSDWSSFPTNTYNTYNRDAIAYDSYYVQQEGEAGDDPNEYRRVDADVYRIFLELAPSAQGESVELGELPELCRQVGRPLRDEHEQFRLMQELDTTSCMVILRHDFVTWLLAEIHTEERARMDAAPRAIPVSVPVWEEVVQEVSESDMMLGNKPTVFYYNTLSGESIWELPSLVRCLWKYLETQEAAQQEQHLTRDGVPTYLTSDDLLEVIQQLRELFLKYDDDNSGYLDSTEFEDMCIHVGQPVNGRERLGDLMQEVDPYSSPVSASNGSGQRVVSWEAFRHYWVINAPFQRRTRLGETRYISWERVELLTQRTRPVRFRHITTLQERWSHPEMEQRVADLLNELFPNSKLDCTQKIDLFLNVQWNQQQLRDKAIEVVEHHMWTLETCWRVFTLLEHPMSRRQHVQEVVDQLQRRFRVDMTVEGDGKEVLSVDEAVVRAWLVHCMKKVEMEGWEEVADIEGQTYYYHEVSGITQWDSPQLQTQMVNMLSKLGDGQQKLSTDERIARVFRQYDADESGEMTFDEFQHFYRVLLGRGKASSGIVSDEQIRQVFHVLDANCDGAVTLEEFQFWWTTKLQLEVKETTTVEAITREERRRDICREFLGNALTIVVSLAPDEGIDTVPEECFESNLLPRLVALLGEFPLRGLAYRRALDELVLNPMEQLVSLKRFLDWYDRFESIEREKIELQRAKQRAQAELRTQHDAQAAARDKQRRRRKQMRTLAAMSEQAAVITEHEAQQQRDKKIAVLFKTFDHDGSGLLDENELLQLTKALGHQLDAGQVSRMLQVMDSSGDGRINLEEFVAFWKAFEHRRPAPATAATLYQTRRDAVSEPATAAPVTQHLTASDAVASMAVSLEIVKDRALKLTLADLRGFLSDWRDDLLDKKLEQHVEQDEAEMLKKWREMRAFLPSKKRVYGAQRLDVTWIEPEVVDCMAAIIIDVGLRIDPPLKPDAAQQIQRLGRGHLARKHVFELVCTRFPKQIDPQTHLVYFTNTSRGEILLTRPLYPTTTSSVAPFNREDCVTKADRYQFDKRLAECRAKKQFYDQICLPSIRLESSTDKAGYKHRPMLAPSAFFMYDVTSFVQQRLLTNIWTALRSSKPELVLVELIARRRRRQLMQRGGDAAANLPLHYALRHSQFTVPVIRAMVNGYPEALAACDAFGMTPLHLALREKCSSIQLLRLLARKSNLMINRHLRQEKSQKFVDISVWERQTVCGDTPLHVAISHRASVGVLHWVFSACAEHLQTRIPTLFNERGESAFHSCIIQQQTSTPPKERDFTSPRSRTVILLFFKHFDAVSLCSTATKQGDLPLHLAMDAFDHAKQRAMGTSSSVANCNRADIGVGWLWLVELLLRHYPAAVMTAKRSNGLLPVHLAIKYGVPEELSVKFFTLTIDVLLQSKSLMFDEQEKSLLAATTIVATRTTLLHYALVHQAGETSLLSLLINRMPTCCKTSSLSTGDLPIHAAAAAPGLSMEILHKLCEVYNEGCRTYNTQRRLPLHTALIHDISNVDKATALLQHCHEMIMADSKELRGLRALLLAANAKVPNYQLLLTLLDAAPSHKLATASSTKKNRTQTVTPLYALLLRYCTPEITSHGVAKRCHEQFEGLDDEEAYFLAMAKTKLRKQHYNPTLKWTFTKILELIERNPLDEALIQRALHATNEKLGVMNDADLQARTSNQEDSRKRYGTVVDSVTLNSDLMLVRTVHHIMYEFPSNPRLQLLGQAILSKLLPSAYVRAAYKAKINPYFNL